MPLEVRGTLLVDPARELFILGDALGSGEEVPVESVEDKIVEGADCTKLEDAGDSRLEELLTAETVLKNELIADTVDCGSTEAHDVETLIYDPLSTSITKQVWTTPDSGVVVAVAVTVTGTDVVTICS
jgi:hypothetical protein